MFDDLVKMMEAEHKPDVLTLYPLSSYAQKIKDPQPEEDPSVLARVARLQEQYQESGIRRSVDAVIVTHKHGTPHILMLQVANAFFKLPGGYLDPSETDQQGLITRLNEQLGIPPTSLPEEAEQHGILPAGKMGWQVGDCLSVWWKPAFDSFLYPYLPSHITKPKEIKKLYLVHLPPSSVLAIPSNMKLLAIPIFELYDNTARYGPQLSAVPHMLSRYQLDCRVQIPA